MGNLSPNVRTGKKGVHVYTALEYAVLSSEALHVGNYKYGMGNFRNNLRVGKKST